MTKKSKPRKVSISGLSTECLPTLYFIMDSNQDIFELSKRGKTEEIRELLKEKKVEVNVIDDIGWTPLHWASYRGHVETVKVLITERGAEVNVKSDIGTAPLHQASSNGHVETVRILLALGAEVNLRDEYRETPLHYASILGHMETVRVLLENGAEYEEDWLGELDEEERENFEKVMREISELKIKYIN